MAKKEKPKKEKKEKAQKAPLTGDERFHRFWMIWNLVEAALLLGAGIAAIIAGIIYKSDSDADKVVLEKVLPYVVGSFVIMDGILRVIMTIFKKKRETEESILLISGFEVTIGIVCMLVAYAFTDIMVYFVSILLIVVGALLIVFSVFTILRRAAKLFIPVFEIIFSAALIAVGIGILVMYTRPGSNNQVVLIIAGSIMTIASIALAASVIMATVKEKKEKNAVVVVDGDEAKKPSKKEDEPTPEKKMEDRSDVIEEAEVIDDAGSDETKQIENKE